MPKHIKTWMTSRRRTILIILGALIFAFLVFHLGMAFEGERFAFEEREMGHGNQMTRGTMGPFGIPLPFPHDLIVSDHGTVGMITAVSLPEIDIASRTGENRTVLITSSTILHGEGTTTLRTGETITVIGQSDNEGRIVAQFIRIFPPPPQQ